MDEYLHFDKYSFNDLRDEIFSAKWRKPKDMRDDIPKMVEREFRKRQIKHGLPVNR